MICSPGDSRGQEPFLQAVWMWKDVCEKQEHLYSMALAISVRVGLTIMGYLGHIYSTSVKAD